MTAGYAGGGAETVAAAVAVRAGGTRTLSCSVQCRECRRTGVECARRGETRRGEVGPEAVGSKRKRGKRGRSFGHARSRLISERQGGWVGACALCGTPVGLAAVVSRTASCTVCTAICCSRAGVLLPKSLERIQWRAMSSGLVIPTAEVGNGVFGRRCLHSVQQCEGGKEARVEPAG